MAKPRWGFVEIVAVYIGIMASGLLFARYADNIKSWLTTTRIADQTVAFFTVGYLFQFFATILLVLLFTIVLNRARLKDLGVRLVNISDGLRYGLLGGFLLFILIIGLSLIITILQPEVTPQLFEEMLRKSTNFSSFVILLILGSVLAPLSEELYYRGMIYPVFRSYLGPLGGALIAGLLFGLVHWDLWRTIPLAAGGAILCYIYEKSGSILVSALAHGIWNGVMSIIVYYSIVNI